MFAVFNLTVCAFQIVVMMLILMMLMMTMMVMTVSVTMMAMMVMTMTVTQPIPTSFIPTRWESVIMIKGGNMTQSISHHIYKMISVMMTGVGGVVRQD